MSDPDKCCPGIEWLKARIDVRLRKPGVANREPLECVMAETHSDACVRASSYTIHGRRKRTGWKVGRTDDNCGPVTFYADQRHIRLQLDPSSLGTGYAIGIAGREHVRS